jgi:hypothetical protein
MKMQKIVLIAALLLLCSVAANGQSCITYTYNYAASWDMAMTSTPAGGNGSSVGMQFGVLVDGTANMTVAPGGCGINGYHPDLSHVTHTPQMSITVGSNNANQNGATICYDCYMNSSMTENYTETIGNLVSVDPGVDIVCSYGGIFFNWFPTLQAEGAFTFVQNTTPTNPLSGDCVSLSGLYIDGVQQSSPQQFCRYAVTNWCTNTPDADYGTGPFYIALAVADVQGVPPATGNPARKGWWLNFWIPLWRVVSNGNPVTAWDTVPSVFPVFSWLAVLRDNNPFEEQLQYQLLPQSSTTYIYPRGICTGNGGTAWIAPSNPDN